MPGPFVGKHSREATTILQIRSCGFICGMGKLIVVAQTKWFGILEIGATTYRHGHYGTISPHYGEVLSSGIHPQSCELKKLN